MCDNFRRSNEDGTLDTIIDRRVATMSKYDETYRSKLMTVEETLNLVKDGDLVAHGSIPNEPEEFLSRLHTIAERVKHVEILCSMNHIPHEFLMNPAYKDKFTVRTNFFGSAARESNKRGIISYIPAHLFRVYLDQMEHHPADVLVTMVSPMDEHGYFQNSLSLPCEREFMDVAKTIIVEVNENMPRLAGDSQIHIRDVAAVYEHNSELRTIQRSEASEVDKQIASHVAELVRDGDTLQVGIGSMPDTLLGMLKDRNDLGLHTEMITSSMADLVEMGVVTGKRKTLHKGKTVGSFVTGDQRLYDFVAGNPHFFLRSVVYVNDPRVICQNDNMVAINTSLMVDLTGQIASEAIGNVQYSGVGGQFCYAQGAAWSKNGRFIIAIKSTAKDGTVSSITPSLPPCTPVSVLRSDADYIVTEHGMVRLRALSVRERAQALISIAHPKFRDELTQQAKDLNYI